METETKPIRNLSSESKQSNFTYATDATSELTGSIASDSSEEALAKPNNLSLGLNNQSNDSQAFRHPTTPRTQPEETLAPCETEIPLNENRTSWTQSIAAYFHKEPNPPTIQVSTAIDRLRTLESEKLRQESIQALPDTIKEQHHIQTRAEWAREQWPVPREIIPEISPEVTSNIPYLTATRLAAAEIIVKGLATKVDEIATNYGKNTLMPNKLQISTSKDIYNPYNNNIYF